jgi:hypothetical protein
VHLEQVEGWLTLSRVPGEPDYWRVDAVIGPIGALADAWGRLTLLSHVTNCKAEVHEDLLDVMNSLAGLLSRLLSGDVAEDEVQTLQELAARVRALYQRVVLDRLPG